ncbi:MULTISPECIES: hybrid non-ribosomal peptide synthetase/type I polyketide synthase [Actinoalloteichus]|uniref:Amino acid adenylation enzyme/thioester reductase family protein n=1 Tax=Actinoalloteichus fjordicus TaxID=1612552 RepID=A0AAC9LD26_9PSEU|nr:MULTISPECIES: hybrid non-ribosomal peptide synthetase/type I polyketide synthase [Actinoalloteichus]APU15628.1 amino acid adenylation enzyme/thioester reductase family protein [Actinoalloteichus fjordicus]APU21688.1 amino acid adenylation enzyme/thioester reductase family protein [Actinoalloteichus sp. GBA129-24]
MTESQYPAARDKVAIIGIGCRLPGSASDYRTFWQNLLDGKDCITPTPADRYDVGTLGSRDKTKPGRLVGGRGGYIDGFDEFDPAFFGISPREADHMDPQQRKLLEVAWEALEDGGQKPGELAGTDVGVFVGAFTLDYKIVQFADLSFDTLAAHTATGTMMTMVSNRISYCFDFRGPSLSIDTACSSSLVAVDLACRSLRRGETNLALAGGTLLHMTPQYTIAETKGGFLSPDGRSRTFDASANGYVRAEGVGVIALKRLDDAVRDGDPIHAVIIGSGVNQDGRTSGITVPNPEAQISLIDRVCAEAGIAPGDLQYVEAHGTSTPVGDPLEANALGQALAIGRKPDSQCYVGSVKTNIGHTESAAGIAGLIKVALSLKHQKIPPHINLDHVNPAIDLAALPYEIPTEVTDWPAHDGPARAGVNAFGFGGTNAHVLLEEAPRPVAEESTHRDPRPGYNILPLTARDPAVLPDLVRGIQRELAGVNGAPASLAAVGGTLAHRRQHLESRLSVVYSSRESLDERLAAFLAGEAHPHVLLDQVWEQKGRRLVWAFTGMGPQWWAMGRLLYESEPVYREAVDRCDREIAALAGWSLVAEMNADEADSHMAETWLAQPANFAVQVGLAALWRSYGVRPDAVVGHSTGEVAAFYEAGVYSLRDAVTVVVHRSRLQQKLVGTGTMLAVSLSEDDAARRIESYGDRVSIAAINSPTAMTLAGDEDALAEIADVLRSEQVFARFLTVRVPYHSARMDLVKDELLSSLAEITPQEAKVPLYLTAREGLAHGTELDASYWWHNVRDSVRFQSAIDRLVDDGHGLFLEIGPHPVLGHSIRECLDARAAEGRALPSIRRNEDEAARIAMSLASLHNLGVDIDWTALHREGPSITLPRYPFKRDRYWVEPKPVEQIRLGRLDHPLLGRRMANVEPTWEARLDVEKLPYLADHRIQGNVVFPAAGYLEMAVQAVRAMTGGAEATIADVELRKALFLPDDEVKTVQLAFSSEDAGFTIATVGAEEQEPSVHACGVLRTGQRRRLNERLDLDAIRARTARRLDSPDCYAGLARLGYEYGPAFQCIEEVWVGADEALARIRPAEVLGDDAAGHHFHPALLDACFQSLLTPQLLDDHGADDPSSTGIRLPLSIDEVRFAPVGDQPLWVHAVVTRREGDELRGDIVVFSDTGVALGRIGGFRAADVEKAATTVGLATIDRWLTEVNWIDAPLPPEAVDDGRDALGAADPVSADWLIFADGGGVADELAELVMTRGGRCHLVRPGLEYAMASDRRESTVEPGSAEQLARLFAELADGGVPSFGTIVHLWNLDLPSLEDTDRSALAAQESLGTYSLIALAQTLSASAADDSPAAGRLHIVTRGTQAVSSDDQVEPLGAPAWGVGRVLWNQELIPYRGKLIDLDAAAGRAADSRLAEARALLREASIVDEDEIALRADGRRTSRLTTAEDLTRPLPLRLRPDGSYLVTGAFGALGRLLCRTLVARGARRLILVGRTRLPARDRWHEVDPDTPAGRGVRLLTELASAGAETILAPLDITDEDGLTSWLAEYRANASSPIRGVFHLAGHVRDTLVPDMDRTIFDAVHDPKVVGAYLLHHHLRDEPLDHFVLFASVASLLTTAGQTNYAAGNAFLDALAHHRRARGLPALSIDWGPWATGMIEELGLIDHYRNSRGMSSLSPDAGMAVLERVIGQDRAQLLVATVVDWPVFLAWYPSPPSLVAELAASATEATADGSSFLDAFRDADEEKRRLLLTEHFTAVVATVLRVKTEQVDPSISLGALGLDSLLAMELRARIHTELKVALPVVALLSSAPISEAVAQLHDGLVELVAAGDDDAAADAVELYDDERAHPLTQNQTALWFLKQLSPDGFAYNIGGAVEVRVELEPELMFQAVRTLIARHPSLRANFTLHEGRPVQQLRDVADIPDDIALFDVVGRDWDDIYQMIIQEYRKPYDLERDPLIRFRLFKRADDRWVIMKAVHHIISDAISTFTFIEELLAVYEGLREGRSVELAPPSASYLDFLNWQNRFLAGRDAQRMLDYWQDHLPAEVPILNLPTDRPRPVVQTYNGASEFFALDAELSARVHALAREHDVTVFMVLMSAYYVLLHRYTGQDDVIVGSPVTGRTQKEFSSVYGYFVNPLPLYVDLGGAPSVAALLEQVRATVLNGLDNQEYPFVLLVEKLGLQHDPSRSAVFQAMFILLVHKVATEKYGYRLDYIELPEEEGQFDLTLSVYEEEADQRFHCVFKYNTDLFLSETMRRMASHYVTVLESLTQASASTPISRLDLLGVEERSRILGEFSGVGRVVEHEVPVHELISRQAAEQPDALAVSSPPAAAADAGGEAQPARLTYGELDGRAARLAGRLRALGVGPGSVVALCLEKSPELIVTVLAVLKTGGAYLPLDPDHPTDRLAFMVRNVDAAFAVVDAARRDRLSGLVVQDVLTLEDLHREAETAQPLDPEPVDAASPAYVIYTSGSTGRPKAVQVSHRSLASAYDSWRGEYRLDTDVRVHLQMASFSFDVFTGDLVRALCSGGTLVLVTRELLFDTARLHRTMLAERVDCGEFVPAVVRALMNTCDHEGLRLDFLRLLIVGSDAWKVEEYQRLRDLCGPQTRVVNSYGLSEATIDSAYFEGSADGLEPSQMVPIGRPLPNSTLYILDEHAQPVPVGVPGELWVGGDGVAIGYAGDAEQTARRFVDWAPTPSGLALDPASTNGSGPSNGHVSDTAAVPGAEAMRLYRTGDLARWDAEGRVQLLGRVDGQVKVRGHRIEIGEIESQLADWPQLAEAVVTLRPDARGEQTLCAYCIASPGAELDLRDLRSHLAERLPTFMIPSHFVALTALPLSPNGKVDLAALPAPSGEHDEQEYEPPVTLYEVRMAEHWKSLLGLDQVGLRHDFFESGGSSIRLIELIYHLQAEFGISIPVSQLFTVTTLHGMARTVEHIVTGRLAGARPYLRFNIGQGPRVFCFPPAGGHGLIYRRFAAHLPEHEFVAFNYLAGDDKVTQYADLIEELAPEGPCPLFGYSLGGNLAFDVAKVLESRGRVVPNVVIMDSYRIPEAFELGSERFEAFEQELGEHLRKHTGSEILTQETLEQARDYIRFCSRTPNLGMVGASVSVISDEQKVEFYGAAQRGTWHGTSTTSTSVFRGFGSHAEMLDEDFLAGNAGLTREILTGGGVGGA